MDLRYWMTSDVVVNLQCHDQPVFVDRFNHEIRCSILDTKLGQCLCTEKEGIGFYVPRSLVLSTVNLI